MRSVSGRDGVCSAVSAAADPKRMTTNDDVFLSYSWRDREAVESVGRALEERGLSVFLDRWYLVPGRPWQQVLEEKTSSCRAVAVFIGPEGLGRWQQREKELALDRQVRDTSFPVIPVLLPDADSALGFLGLNTWVDLRWGANDTVQLDVLAAAIRGEPPGPDVRERVEATLATVCPYRGLRYFREEDAPFVFGREEFTERLAAAVDRESFIAVVGASGSGKSSVVRAGLVPRLRRATGDRVWDVVTVLPGKRPLLSLAGAMVPLLEPDLDEIGCLLKVNKLAAHLQAGELTLRDLVDRALELGCIADYCELIEL